VESHFHLKRLLLQSPATLNLKGDFMVKKISQFDAPSSHGTVLPEIVMLAGEIYKEPQARVNCS
jgi:hypothetical protein